LAALRSSSALISAVETCFTPFGTIIALDDASATVQIYAYPADGNPLHTIGGPGAGCAFTP
jgi:hypothetical protein